MADEITVSVFGNKAMLENLAHWGIEVQAEAHYLLKEAGKMALEIANERVPVGNREYEHDGEEHPGYLKSRNQVDTQEGVVTVSNDASYSIPVVLGHHTRSGSFVPPNDFLTPAMQEAGIWLLDELKRL